MRMPDPKAKTTDVPFQLLWNSLKQAREFERPEHGWLRYYRNAFGFSASGVARKMKVSRHLPTYFERAEVEERITLRSLRAMAEAMNFDLVYGLVLKKGPRTNAASAPSPAPAATTKGSPADALDIVRKLTKLLG